MDTCEHCHNILAKSIDRCTVCGTQRADPFAGDVRHRQESDTPAHAPGWAPAPIEGGLHPDEFLRELTGESTPDVGPLPAPPPRTSATPSTGALAGYLGITVDRAVDGGDSDVEDVVGDVPPPPRPPPPTSDDLIVEAPVPSAAVHPHEQLTTATKLTADGVAARSTRLDGSVKLGPTSNHTVLTFGAPIVAGLVLIAAVIMSYQVNSSEAASDAEDQQVVNIDAAAIPQTAGAVVRLDLDGCGVVDQATGFLFADQAILVPRSAVMTDDRPTVVMQDGANIPGEIVGWSLTRDLAVIRADQRLAGGLRWGVSGRSSTGDPVSVLAVTGPGSAAPVPAAIESITTTNGIVTGFELDISPAHGSVVLNTDGFVIGIIDEAGSAMVSDDLSPAVSRVVLANDRPAAECPPRPTTVPPDPVETDDEG